MRFLKAVTAGMAVLIIAGTAVLIGVIVKRSAPGSGEFAVHLQEPAGTQIAGVAGGGDRLAVQLRGGGSDRIVVVDPRSGAVTGRITLGE